MDYMTLKEAAEKWGVTPRRVNYYCAGGRIPGAVKMAGVWLIPKTAEKPIDGRTKQERSKSMSNILLLEDDLSLINGLSFAFKKQGFELVVARTLKEADSLWVDGKYDLLVLDVSLPDGTGFEFAKRCGKFPKSPSFF